MIPQLSLTPVVLAAALFGSAYAKIAVDTPVNVEAGKPAHLTWSGATPPVLVVFNQGKKLVGVGGSNHSEDSITWTPEQKFKGTQVVLNIQDAKGQKASSAPFSIN